MIVVRSKNNLQFIVKIFYSLLTLSFTLSGKDNNLDHYRPEQNKLIPVGKNAGVWQRGHC